MAKIHLDRLQRRYKNTQIKGAKYSDLLKQILDNNISNIQRGIYGDNKKKWESFGKKFRKDKDIRLVLPSEEEVIPKRALQVIKVAESGKLVSDKLRDQVTKNLRDALFNFDEESYITRRGAKAGRINPRLIDVFEKDLTNTFESYTKKDKKFGMPKNVHTIAVTEVRSAINNVKNEFVQKVMANNPNVVVKKKWIHNRRLSKVPRRGHIQVSKRRAIDYNDFFDVPHYVEKGGRFIKVGSNKMRFPHDPAAPVEQKASCNCDYDIIVTKRKV